MNHEALRPICCILLLSLLLAGRAAAQDDAYSIELILFERPGGGTSEVWPAEPGAPDLAAPSTRLASLPAAEKTLGPVAFTLKKRGMVVHEHLAWLQTPSGLNSNSWYSLGAGRLNGLIRVTRGRFLHLDTDLLLTDGANGETYRVQLHRRMRSGELHYVDHPKLGVIIQAERHRPPGVTTEPADATNGEPKPATPAATVQPG